MKLVKNYNNYISVKYTKKIHNNKKIILLKSKCTKFNLRHEFKSHEVRSNKYDFIIYIFVIFRHIFFFFCYCIFNLINKCIFFKILIN